VRHAARDYLAPAPHLEHGLPPGAQAMLSEQAEGAARMFGMHAGPTAGAGQSVAVAQRHSPLPM